MNLPKVNIKLASVLHALLIAMQGINYVSAFVPEKDKYIVAFVLALIQAGVGFLQHFSPPPSSPTNGK